MTWTEEQYKQAQIERPHLRLAKAVMDAARALVAESGESMSALVSRLILAESEESTRPKKKSSRNP